jgi:hypothetical protein
MMHPDFNLFRTAITSPPPPPPPFKFIDLTKIKSIDVKGEGVIAVLERFKNRVRQFVPCAILPQFTLVMRKLQYNKTFVPAVFNLTKVIS